MRGPPVVLTNTLGRPVTNVISERGAVPMVVVNTLGEPVTLVAQGGEPVTLFNENGTLWDYPFSLFSNNEQGAWYDPSDFSTLYQDSAGTTPVTAVEQPVGLMLDRSGRGNNATAPNDASRPVLRARYNLLTRSEEFDDGVWSKNDTTVVANAGVAPNGTTTADLVYPTTTGTSRDVSREISGQITGTTYQTSIRLKNSGKNFAYIYNARGAQSLYVDLTTGATSNVGTNINNLTSSIDANGWVTVAFNSTLTDGVTTAYIFVGPVDAAGSLSVTANGTDGILLWGAQLLTAADEAATGGAYQRIAAATDYDVSNPVWRPYLAFDGTDDAMTIASSIHDVFQNVGGGAMWAGYNATSTIGAVVVFVSTNTSAGATRAGVLADASGGRRLDADSFVSATDSGFAVNNTYVATNVSDWAGGNMLRRTNGVQVASTAYSSGAGNTSNTASLLVSLGANSSPLGNFLAGRLYSAIILGRAATTAELTATESWIAGKTGVTL